MKDVYVKDIKDKDRVEGLFLVSKKETGMSRTGKPYLSLKLMDSSGELDARVWDNATEIARRFEKDDVVFVKAFAVPYQGRIQLNVSAATAVGEGDYSIRDFLPASEADPEEMIIELDRVVDGLKDRYVKALLKSIVEDRELREKLMLAPAAKSMHHPYLGGLLEHVLSLCGLADKVSGHYGSAVNRDILIAGAILHDIGKIFELSYKRSFGYTDEGRLLGHITMGVELVDAKMKEIEGFPPELALHIKHMLLSHHGHLEFGSPKRPKTLNSIILSYLDDLDAKVNAVLTLKQSADESGWSPYQRIFERYIYTGGYVSEEEPAPSAREQGEGGPEGEGETVAEEDELTLFK